MYVVRGWGEYGPARLESHLKAVDVVICLGVVV
jgi:hypothetical protein